MDWLHILSIAVRVLLVVLLVGLVIFVHELGHFLAARRLGLVVDVFSLGFGPALWKRKIGDVVYKICLIPLGGYVAIPQLDPAGMEKVQGENTPNGTDQQQERVLPPVPPWKRIVVAVAGPLGNVALAVVLAWTIYLTPHAVTGGASNLIGYVDTNSPAFFAGLRPGQVIERVNGARVATWYDFMIECHLVGDPSKGVELMVSDSGVTRALQVPMITLTNAGINLGAVYGLAPKSLCAFIDVFSNSVAAAAGLMAGDVVRQVNGLSVVGAQQFVDYMAGNGTNPVCLELMREGKPLTLKLSPRMDEKEGRPIIGVRPGDMIQDVPPWMHYSNPWRQIKSDGAAVFRILQALLFPQHKGESQRAANAVGGMPTIVVVLWGAVSSGLLSALGLLRMISINLAIINLLPIPVLDGGHILFALLEMITRRKLNPKVMAVVVNVFAVLLIGLMLLLIVRDPVVRPWTDRILRWRPAAAASTNAVPAAVALTNDVPPAAATNLPAEGAAP
ncbi:MAG: RIP metalloprotease RseP [Kiritimatiellia bacterium]